MSNNEETKQSDDTSPVVYASDLQTADTNVKSYFATCFDDDSGSGAAESLSTHEAARDDT